MLSQIEKTLLLDAVTIVVVAIFAFAIISTLMAVSFYLQVPPSWRRKRFSVESVESAKSAITRRKCRAWAERKGEMVV